MNIEDFLHLDRKAVQTLVRARGPQVVVCPINGTRRWFALEGRNQLGPGDFLRVILEKYRELIDLFFKLGIETLLTPILGPDIVQRGDDTLQMVFRALEEITLGEAFRAYYRQRDVRVRFYGDFEPYFTARRPEVLGWVRRVQRATRPHTTHRLFWGMFAHDPVEGIARAAVDFHREYGELPGRDELVARYYGESVPPAGMFIGMMPPAVFDFPLLDTGGTALYFTTAPTPYLQEPMLRRMLFDYLFVRPVPDDYSQVPDDSWSELQACYAANRQGVVGLGRRAQGGHFWLPVPAWRERGAPEKG